MLCCCLCHRVAGTPRDLLCDVFRTQILPPPNGNQSSMRLLQSFQVTAASAKWQKATECKQFDAILENCYILKSWKAWWKCEKKVRVLDFFAQTPPCWEFLLIFSLQNLPNIVFVTFDKILCCFSFTITLWANRQDLRGLWSTETLKKVFTWHSSAATMLVSNIRILSSWNIYSVISDIENEHENDLVLTMMHMLMMMMLMTLTCMLQYSFLNMVHSRWAVSRRGRSPATARLETKLLFFFYIFLHEDLDDEDVDKKSVVHCLLSTEWQLWSVQGLSQSAFRVIWLSELSNDDSRYDKCF